MEVALFCIIIPLLVFLGIFLSEASDYMELGFLELFNTNPYELKTWELILVTVVDISILYIGVCILSSIFERIFG